QVVGGAALPPARVIVEFDDLVEAELLIVVRPNPFRSVDGALLKRRIDIATGDLLRDDAELAKCLSGPTSDTHLETLEVAGLFDLLVEPTAHLTAGVTGEQAFGIELGAKVVDQFLAIAVVEPCVLLASIESEGNGTEQRPRRILADVVVLGTVAQFDRAVLDGVKDLQAGHDFAGSKRLNLEFAVCRFRHIF